MLKYVDRRGTNCSKWDALEAMYGDKDLLAMWVADMDFEIADPIRKAVGNYVENVPWGYYDPAPSYKQALSTGRRSITDTKSSRSGSASPTASFPRSTGSPVWPRSPEKPSSCWRPSTTR